MTMTSNAPASNAPGSIDLRQTLGDPGTTPRALDAPMLLPEHPPRFGPISKRLLTRLAVGLLIIEAVGTVMLLASNRPSMRAAGLSLVFPGAGFLFDAWPLLFVATLALLLIALVLWWGASAHLAIPVVWFGSALGAALLADGPRLFVDKGTTWSWAIPVGYVLALAAVGTAVYRFERAYRAKRAQVPELNAFLSTQAVAPVVSMPRVARNPDAMDGELLRWCYSLAGQPNDGLVGLDWGEQFHSGTQLRYQLNAVCWGLSLYAANFVPNAQKQAEHALARLIEKHTDPRVWGYWRTLNLLGNFDTNPDPIVRDNIMFSAFLGDVLNIYEAATGSTRFDEPGSLTFVWKDGRAFEYDHHSIAAAVERNFQRSRLGFFPCEPGWSFTVCNVMGAQSLYGHDRLHGTDAWKRVGERWVRTLDEEYSTPDGSYAHIKSNLVGLAWDTGEVPGGHYLAAGSNRFHDILPEHARRASALERRKSEQKLRALASKVVDGRLELTLPETLERSRAIRSALAAWNGVIGGARMINSPELAAAALDASAKQCATGERWPGRPLKSGMGGFGGHMIVRWGSPLSTADLNIRGYVPPNGPIMSDAPWDEILVTEARSPDGKSLHIRMEPLDGPVANATLRFEQLTPSCQYRLIGTESSAIAITADARGIAQLTVAIDSPRALVLELVSGGATQS